LGEVVNDQVTLFNKHSLSLYSNVDLKLLNYVDFHREQMNGLLCGQTIAFNELKSGIEMKFLGMINAPKSIGLGLVSVCILALGACSTTSVSSNAYGGANISYKVGQGAFKNASVNLSYNNKVSPSSRYKPSTPQYQQPSGPVSQGVDLGHVDTRLYGHQKVGKPYKVSGKRYTPRHDPRYDAVGTASWYGPQFHGKPTATGEKFNMNDLTAAHKTLPLNSMVYVTNLQTGKSLKVRVNDRGPFVDGRIIDLSRASAQALGLFNAGLGRVRVQYAGPADPNASKSRAPTYQRPIYQQPDRYEEPQSVAEIPQYKPLRDLGQNQPQERVQTPQVRQPNSLFGNGLNRVENGLGQSVPQSAERLGDVPQGDAPVTLTIKGAIHMASDKNDDPRAQARFIPAVNYNTLSPEARPGK
jgi:rare lipoprotein A (peptidoglycan hydrolase)